MGKSSRLRTFAGIVFLILVTLTDRVTAGEALHVGEERTSIDLINGFYATGSYLKSPDTKEVSEFLGSFGWQKKVYDTTIDVGASHALFSSDSQLGTFKPYVRIHGDYSFFGSQNVKPFIRLDVTPAFNGGGVTLYHHSFGVDHAWTSGNGLVLNQSFAVSGIHDQQNRLDYRLGLSMRVNSGVSVEIHSHTYRDTVGTDNSTNIRFLLRH